MTKISAALARKIAQTIADEIRAQTTQVIAAVGLLDEGATVPFIARYRKEVTEGLDDTNCATSKRACPTCARWKSVAPRSWPTSTNRAS